MQLLSFLTAKNDELIIEKTLKRLSESSDGIIAVDDGSTDRTYDIIRSFDKVVKIIRNEPNGEWNIFRDCEKVMDEVGRIKPEWLMYIDSDDLLDKRFAERKKELLDDKSVGRYHFKEITLWGSIQKYRDDKPEWYSRDSGRTPYLVRWSPDVYINDPYAGSVKQNLLRKARKNQLVGYLKRKYPFKKLEHHSPKGPLMKYMKESFWPTDFMDYTNILLLGYEGKEVELDLVKMHYHFADMSYAWKKHMNYALQSAIRHNRTPGEIPNIVNWATEKLNEDGLVLKDVNPEWGAL